MNRKYILIAVILAVVVGGGILSYYYLWIAALETRLSELEVKLSEKVIKDEMAEWKTYKNEKYRFSFRHPNLESFGKISAAPSPESEFIITLGDRSTAMPGTDKPWNGFSVYVEPNTSGQSFQEYIEEQKQRLLPDSTSAQQLQAKESSITVGGVEGVILTGYIWFGADMIYVPFPNDKKILVIAKIEASKGSFDTTFNKILSTFRFLE